MIKNGILESLSPMVLLLLSSVLLSGCVFESDLEPTQGTILSVSFDWSGLDDDPQPATMALAIFADGAQPVQTAFNGRDGGEVSVLANTYKLISFNDDAESLFSRGNTWETFELFSQPTTFSRLGTRIFASTRSVPVARGTEDEQLVFEPDSLWSSAAVNIVVEDDSVRSVTMAMENAITEYHFTINNVENLSYAVEIMGTVSGMSGSWMPALHHGSDTHCIIPFALNGEGTTLEGTIRTYGHCPGKSADDHADHMLTIYAEMKDGSRVYFTSDITEAMHDPDHTNPDDGGNGNTDIPIVINELPLPKPITNGSGLQPGVSEWTEVEISVPMN